MIALGGIALAVSPFLTWVNALLFGGIDLFNALLITGHSQAPAWLATISGSAAALIGWTGHRLLVVKTTTVFIGLISVAGSIWALLSLTHDSQVVDGFAQVSYGPWVAILGAAAVLSGGLLLKRAPSQAD
ncbi:MAG: hypothetical protein WB507_06720 [Solirubrobacterales bacterium]